MKIINFFIISILVVILIIPMTLSIDSSICQSENPVEDYKSCLNQQEPLRLIWEQKSAEADKLSSDFFAADSDYNICLYNTCAKGSTNPITTTEIKTDNDEKYCIELICEPALKAYNNKAKQLDLEEAKLKNAFDLATCNNCVIPFCIYQMHNDCYQGKIFCEKMTAIPQADYIGCEGDKYDKPLIDAKDVPMGAKKSTNVPITTSKEPQKKLTAKQEQKKQENEQKIQKIKKKPNVEVIEIKTNNGKKEIVLNNPDNSKASAVDKVKYHMNNNAKKMIGDEIGNIPILGPYKDYILKFFDDQKSDDAKTIDTQVQLGVGKNAAKQFNLMDGIGDKELSLSPGKNLIPSTPLTKPYEFVFDQLGFVVKKTMAHGYNSEYNSVLDEAKVLRESGSTWSATIKTTFDKLVQTNVGKRWSQTLKAYSKDEFKDLKARVNLYILQMKENGELK